MREKLIDLISGGVPRHEPFLSKVFEGLADHLIANGVRLEEKQATSDESKRWIPVTERLPEDMDDRVLVLLETSYHYPIGNQQIDTDRYRGEYRKWVRYGDKVTHWMPLPEPPKGE